MVKSSLLGQTASRQMERGIDRIAIKENTAKEAPPAKMTQQTGRQEGSNPSMTTTSILGVFVLLCIVFSLGFKLGYNQVDNDLKTQFYRYNTLFVPT